ncbi:MAG: hypothetical protein DRJ97_02235 [Thermoprotei archaeon]|nr:MAG: hypothetical protein DRJ97_02235 [Thermoprotei archaeon]
MVKAVFVGHVSVDKVRNLNGERVQPGGAALYAAMAAKSLGVEALLVTALGYDYPFKEVIYSNFPPQGIKLVEMPSTRFEIEYDDSWNAKYLKVEIGAGSKITVSDVVKPALLRSDAVHLAPMNPPKVLRMVEAIKRRAPGLKISINTCSHYLERNPRNRACLLKAAELADVTIVSDHELRLLTGVEAIAMAARKVKAKILVVTLGELGALIKEGDNVELTPALAGLVKNPVDTTGAGDVWCGAFLATYTATGDLHKATSIASILSAIKCLGWNFERISKLRFKEVDEVFELATSFKEAHQKLTKWLGGPA